MTKNGTKHLRILTFAPMPPTITGGIEEYAYSVVDGMRKEGMNVTVVTSRFHQEEGTIYPAESEGYLYIPSKMFFKRPFPTSLSAFVRVAKAIRQSDIVHIHMPYPFLESFAAFMSKVYHKKIVVTYHMDAKIDTESENTKEPLLHTIIQKLYTLISARWPLSYCDIICSNTMAYAENSPILKRYLGKVKVVYQGIRKDLYDFLDVSSAKKMREIYLGQQYSYLVTFVGRLVPYKGLKYLIEAIDIIGKDKGILFIIGGNGPQKEHLVELVKKYNLTNVIFAGFVKDEDLFNLFAASDLVVSPSVSELESTPISLLSALAAGTPVIGTSIGGTAESIPNDGKWGSIIPPKESKILADTIEAMLENKNDLRITNKLLPRFWSSVASDYLIIIHELVNRDKEHLKEATV